VIAPPYDVIAPEEVTALRSRSPYNSVRIELPDAEGDLDPYQSAAGRIRQWQAEGILRRDPAPTLYGYRMTYTDPTGRRGQTVGVIGALGLEPPGSGQIFPHEQTTPKAKSDRLHLLQATQLNTSPIWALSLATGLSEALASPENASSVAVTDDEGIRHELWLITDPETIVRVSAAVGAAPVVIADGHHRFETALTYQRESPAAAAGAVMALVVELADEQLSVLAIHRLIAGLPADFDVLAALARHFDVTATTTSDAALLQEMAETDSLALVTPGGVWLLRPTPETTAAAAQDLPSSQLEVARADFPDHEVVYEPTLERALGALTRGQAQAAVLLRPVTVEQIASTGRGGARMPPKTTFFWPKPRTGFVFREVAD
jgi:uncharacterized protein (DUF1015 family)